MGEQSAVLGLGSKIEAGTKQAFSTIADGFRQIAKAMSDSAAAMRKVGQEAPAKIFEDTAKSINKLTSGLDKQVASTKMLSKAQVEGRAVVEAGAAAQEKAASKLAKANAELEKTPLISAKAAAQLDVLKTKFHDVLNAPGSAGKSANTLLSSFLTPGVGKNGEATLPKISDGGQTKILEVQLQRLQASYRETTAVATKSAATFQSLNAKFPGFEKHIRALDKTNLSYQEQINVLKRLKTARAEEEAKQRQANKELIKTAALNEKASASVNKLARDYSRLLASKGATGANARNLFAQFVPQASDSKKIEELKARLAELQKKFGEVTTAATKSAAAFQSLNAKFPQYGKQIAALQKTNLSYQEQINVLKRLDEAKKREAQSSVDYSRQSEGIQRLRKQYADLRLSTDRYGQAANKILGNIRAHNIEIGKAGAALGVLQRQQRIAERGFTTLGGAVNLVITKLRSYSGYLVASSAIFTFIAGIRTAVSTVATYDQSLKDLQAITGATNADLTLMADTMKKVASDTKFSAAETAEGMKLLGQAGLDAKETVAAIPGVTNLATGTMTDLATVVDLTSTTLRAFGLAAKDTGYITDVFANAVNKSKLTIEDIKTAFNYIAPAAHNAGMSLDETARVMMVLRDNGLKASSMATGFRRILAKLAIPTESFKKNVKAAGLTLADFDVNSQGISRVLHNLSKVVTTNKEAFADFGVYGSAAVTALIKDVDKFDLLGASIGRSGSAAEMAQIQLQGLQLMFKNLQDKVKNLWIAMGEGGLTGVLKAMVNVARGAVDVLTDLASNGVVRFAVQATLAAAAAHGLVLAFQWFKGATFITSALSSISLGLAAVQVAMGSTTTSTIALTMALNSLKAGFMTFLPTAIVAAIGYVIYEVTTYTQALKDNAVEIRAVTSQVEDQIVKLNAAERVFKKNTATQNAQSETLEKLIADYPRFATALRTAMGDGEDLARVLGEIRKEQEALLQQKLGEAMANTSKLLIDNSLAASKYEWSLRELIQSQAAEDETRKQFSENNAKYTEQYIRDGKAKKLTDKQIVASFREAMRGKFLSSNEVDKMVAGLEAALKSMEDPAYQAMVKVGKAGAAGIIDGLELAEEFDKSIATIDFKSSNQKLEKGLAERLYAISVAEAKGTVAHEEAELTKLNATIKAYDEMVEVAKAYAKAADAGGTPEQQTEAQTRVDAAVEKANQVRLQKLEVFGQKRIAIEEKLSSWQEKRIAEEAKHDDKVLENRKGTADKLAALEKASGLMAKSVAQDVLDFREEQSKELVELEEEATTKIVEIARDAKDKRIEADKDYEDKRAELVKARVEIERSAAADITGLQDSLQDKITNIRMKGLEGQAKESALASAAAERLAAGQQALAEAKAKNDKEAIDRAKELIESAGGYYDQLENPTSAISGLQQVTDALIEARKAQEQVELAENQSKLAKEKALHRDKINEINKLEDEALKKNQDRFTARVDAVNNYYAAAMAKEQARHNAEMQHIDSEIAKLKEKAAAIANQQSAVINSPAPSGGSDNSGGGISPDFNWEQYERDVGIATAKGIQKGVTDGTTMSAEEIKKAVSDQVAAGTREGLFDGVKVDGVPLEEWKAQGREQGAVMGQATTEAVAQEMKDFDITENLEGAPVSVVISPATKKEVEPLLDSIREALDKYPGEPSLDFTKAEKMIREFVRDAQRRYTIEIPVTTTQGKAAGGQTYAMAGGGRIPGTKSPKDKVKVLSRPGEWWIPDEQSTYWARNLGDWFMNAVHKPMSQAGQYLKNSVLKGPTSRAVPIPVPAQSGINTNVLSSLNNLGTLDARIGDQVSRVVDALASATSGGDTYQLHFSYSGAASQASAKTLAKSVMNEFMKMHKGRS